MTYYEKTFVKFATAGCTKINEPLRIHGRLIDIVPVKDLDNDLELGYKVKVIPSQWLDLRGKLFPKKKKYLLLPLNKEQVFYSSLFVPNLEVAAYMAKTGQRFTLCYLGSVTGQPAIDTYNILETIDRLAFEKGAYKYAAIKMLNLLVKIIQAQDTVDKKVIERYIDMFEKFRRTEHRPPGRPPKEDKSTDEDYDTNVKLEDAHRGHGVLARVLKRV